MRGFPDTSDNNQYVNHSPDSNSFFFNHLMKTEASGRPAQDPRPQDIGVGPRLRKALARPSVEKSNTLRFNL